MQLPPGMDRHAGPSAVRAKTDSNVARPGTLTCQGEDGGTGFGVLPRHLWCAIAEYNHVVDSTAALQSCASLLEAFEVEVLWLHYCLTNDFARPAAGPDAKWISPFLPQVKLTQCINWRRLLRVNMRSQRRPAVWVRFKDIDLRFPSPSGVQSTRKALLEKLASVVSLDGTAGPPQPPAADGREGSGWPFRLRRMQWGGRPGAVVQDRMPLAGGRFLLEWPSPGTKTWPLPTTLAPPRLSSTPRAHPSEVFNPGITALMWLQGGSTTGPGVAGRGASPVEETDGAMMLRVVSFLLPRELWLTVCSGATLETLYGEVAAALRRESPLIAEMGMEVQCHLMDSQRPHRKAGVQISKPLRELFWAQSETVRVELEPSGAGSCTDEGSQAAPRLVLLIWREQPFVEIPAVEDNRAILAPPRCVGPAVQRSWDRQVSEPAPMHAATQGWDRQVTEPCIPSGSHWGRLVSEPPPLPPQRCAPTVEAMEDEEEAETGQPPGSAAVDCPEDLLVPGGSRTGGSAAASDGGPYSENVVPHFAPQLLPRSMLARQFEFHPTLPEVLLTGDRKGSVNILELDTDEVHPPLMVGICPLLGLVWMKNYPQRAICGESRSGKVQFLGYDPNARMSEPALQRLHAVEAFPQLSSLSSNCTNDYLLASGSSHNILVYDVQTGGVLQRAQGIHEHFINISRFCHNSPHIFATASFDRTCKVWDLRQPVLDRRPIKTLNTGGENVMCIFSPDDKYILCSGVDTRITQFAVPSWMPTPEQFPLRRPVHRERYRRSMYLANSRHFVTAATEESHMHLMSVQGRKLGVIDFRGVLRTWNDRQHSRHAGDRASATESCCLQVPRLAMQMESRILAGRAHWPFLGSHRGHTTTSHEPLVGPGLCAIGRAPHSLVQGTVQLDDADPNSGSSHNNHEFIQSVRTHPIVKNRVGVLLCQKPADQSYVALVDIDPRVVDQ